MSPSSPPARQSGPLTALAAAGALGAAALLSACGDDDDKRDCIVGVGTSCPVTSSVGVGDVLSFNVQTTSACGSPITRRGRVVAVSNRAIVVSDSLNPAGGFTDAEYASIAAQFDTLVYPVDVQNFGAPTDRDGNGRVIIFYTSAVNALTPANSNFVIGGFFFSRDIFPRTGQGSCAGSNDGELFYMLAVDPNGTVNGNRRTKAYVAGSTVTILGHEFQHLINASRRLYVVDTPNYDEEVWLNEGLSHVAEELQFYRAANLSPAGRVQSPRSDLSAAAVNSSPTVFNALNTFNAQNLSRLSRYLRTVEGASPYNGNDSLNTRGATWSFLRYAADRAGGTDSSFFYRLVNTRELGLANLRTVTGTGGALPNLFRDWAVSTYADNFVAPALDARFAQLSWNFRSVLPNVTTNGGAFPLLTHPVSDNQTASASVTGGSAAYFPFAVAAGAQATLRTRTATGAGLPALARVSLVRVTAPDAAGGPAVTTYDAGAGGDVTVTNPSAGTARYALVVFNADTTTDSALDTDGSRIRVVRSVPIAVTATGLGAAPAAVVAAQPGPTLARLAAAEAAGEPLITDAPLNHKLRALTQRELTWRVPAARADYQARLQR